MSQFRLIYDESNRTATIVLTEISADEVKLIGTEILKVAIEPATMLKGTGFKDEIPTVPSNSAKETEPAIPFAEKSVSVDSNAQAKVASAEIETNPIPEDSDINTTLLDAPVGNATTPTISNTIEKQENNAITNENASCEDYVFTFGSHKGVGTSDLIAENPAKAFSYFQWALRKGILKTKTPNEEVFKKVVFSQARSFYSQFPLKEDEIKDVAYVMLASIGEAESKEILALLGYSTIDELYTSENVQCYMDAIKMAFA